MGNRHAVLVQEDAVMDVDGVTDGPEAAKGRIVPIETFLLREFQQVAESGVHSSLFCQEWPRDGAKLVSVAAYGGHQCRLCEVGCAG